MKNLRSSRAVKAGTLGTLIVLLIGSVFVFQNCAQPNEGGGLNSSNGFTDFAFESNLDTLAHMSCSDSSGDESTFFTFRGGAYDNGGVRLTSDFHAKAGDLTGGKKVSFLQDSGINTDLRMQLAIRRQSDMVPFLTGSSPQEGKDLASVFVPMSFPDLVNQLVDLTSGERIHTLSGNQGGNRMEGTLRFTESETLVESLRAELRRDALLTLTYHAEGVPDESAAFSPGDLAAEPNATDFNFAFGTGLKLRFRQGVFNNNNPARVMSSVEEIDLISKANTNNQWVCPPELVFQVVRPQDVGITAFCDQVTDPPVPRGDLAIARRVLRVEDWFIDMAGHCIMKKQGKSGSCYGPQPEVEYNSGACGAGAVQCSHFASVCYRQ